MSPLKRLTRVNKADIIDVYKCSVCSEEFHTQLLYDIHMNNHNEDFPYSCDMCQYRCRIRKYLTRHKKKVHTKANGPACTVCGKVFHYSSLLRNHMRVHTGERPYSCEVCNKSFNSSYCLSMHKLIHTNEKPFECKFCEYACRDSSTLRRHEERHLGIGKTYPCRKCKKSFDTKAKLRIHVDEVHYGLNPKQIACEQCGRRFKTLTGKNTHIKTVHERIGRSQCEICDRVISRNNMGAHLKSHVDIRPFSCSFKNCKKQFKDRGTLKKHTLIHYPDLYFQCDLCDSRFVRQARLRQHKKWHVVNGFTCDYCGGIFSTKRYLQMHIKKIHVRAAEKFVCDECESVHFTKQSIILHLKYGHGRRYEKSCRICGDVLQNNAGLSEHYLKVHKVRYILIKKEDDVTIKEEPEDLSQEFVFNYEVEKSEVEDSDLIDGTKMVEVDIPPNIININKLETTLNTCKEPDMKSIDYIPEYADTETTLEYSAKVLEEDLSRSVTESETKQPDSTFEEFFIKEIVDKSKKKKLGKEIVDKNKLVDLQKRIDQMIKETRIQKTSIILEKMRQKYNRRIEMANKNKEKRVPAKIKYFKKSQNETTSESDTITRRDVENKSDISIQNDDLSIEDNYASDHIDGKNTNDETSRPKRTRKKTKKYDDNDDEDNKTGKLKFDGHECNVCFKVFKTKEDLKFHCKEHFDICNEKMLKKCPFCGYVTNLNIKRHIEIVHKININYDYAHIAEKPNASGSKYVFEIDKDCELEIIPSISNLNKIAGMKVDEKRRKENNLFIGKTKLVKKGGEWVVEKQSVGINSDNILPVFTEDDYRKVKLTGDTYLDRLQQLGFLAKKRGAKMLYPCDSCEKICQTLPALKLHSRKHEENPKQFKPKVWVNRHVEYKSKNRKKLRKNTETPRPTPVVFENRKKKSNYMIANRYAAPQPVKNNHKCDKGLIEFYKNHIRGKDIEFWQFLKIFNKINRENVNDFEDLVNRDDVHFGIHSKDECIASNSNRNISQNDTNHKPVTTANSSNESGNKPVTNRNNQNEESLHVNNKPVTTEKSVSQKKKYQIRKNVNKKMRRVIISKSENIRRNAIKNEMRQRLANNTM